jgi:hypothetical protein
MSETISSSSGELQSADRSDATGLQFNRAEYADAPSAATCTACTRPIENRYYEVNGAVVCALCRVQLDQRSKQGSGPVRFVRAAGAGVLAGILGSLLYFIVGKSTGYEFGLIAIVVGFAVGAAVKWGCYGRGGPLYQTLAIVLTYLAIVSTYVPAVIEGLSKADTDATASVSAPAEGARQAFGDQAEASASPSADEPVSLGMVSLSLALVLMIACVAPFLAGLENIMGLLIIGFGLYEAWKINKRSVLSITGPHTLASRRIRGAAAV